MPGINPVTLPGGIAINPITWTRSETPAPASESLGSILLNSDASVVLGPDKNPLLIKNLADARVDITRGVVICSSVDEGKFSTSAYPRGVYHSFDFPFYYYNIRENAANRIQHYIYKR